MFRTRQPGIAVSFVILVSVVLATPRCLTAEQAVASLHSDDEPVGNAFESTGLTIAKRVDEVNLVFTVTDFHGNLSAAFRRLSLSFWITSEPRSPSATSSNKATCRCASGS
jgi:hypothetical protein